MAFPNVKINSNTGSDTLASGAGPTVAISGYFAQSSGTKIITVIGDNPDLSSVNTDGSAVLFFSGSGVRNFSKITSIDNILKTIGCEDNFNLTETAVWAIGGKRKTLDDNNTRRLLRGEAKGGWSVTLETNQDLTSSIIASTVGNGTDGNFNLTASGEGIILNQTANANHITSSGALTPTAWGISNITFTNSNASKTNATALNFSNGFFDIDTCVFGDITNTLQTSIARLNNNPTIIINDCAFIYNNSVPINFAGGGAIYCFTSLFYGNKNTAIQIASNSNVIADNLICANSGDGITEFGISNLIIINNTIDRNTGNGISLRFLFSASVLQIQNNNITQNGGFGIASSANQTIFQTDINFNNFGSGTSVNGSGALLNLNDLNNIYINPNYKSPLTMDYTLGTKLSGYGQPGHNRYIGANISLTRNNKVVGAIQSPNRTRNIDFCGGFVQ